MIRATVWSVLISGVTLLALAAAVLLANAGASRLWFALLLLVPITVGLPSTCGILLITALWSGPPMWAYLASAALTALIFQLPCVSIWYLWRRRRQT